MKRKNIIIILAVLFLAIPTVSFAAAKTIQAVLAPHVQIVSDGKNVDTASTPPIMYNGSTYVPLRTVGEALGYEVKWNDKNARVDLIEDKSNVVIKKDGLEIIDFMATPGSFIVSDIVHINYKGEIIYRITESLQTDATATIEVLDKNNNVVNFENIILKEKEPGTYTHSFFVSNFRTPYNGKNGTNTEFETKATEDYSYRLILR